MIHFDTNFLIQTVIAGSAAHEKFRAWVQTQEACNASSIAWAEFLCGPLDAPAEAIARQIFPNPRKSRKMKDLHTLGPDPCEMNRILIIAF